MKNTRKILALVLVLMMVLPLFCAFTANAEEATEETHVNTLAVGDTNKIIVDNSRLNSLGYYVAVVPFEVTQKAIYTFATTGYAWIYNGDDETTAVNLCGYKGSATLDVGTYYIWICALTPATTGEFNVSVTMTPILPEMVLGENNVTVTGETLNAAKAPVEWYKFVVTEKAHYEFVGNTYAFIYSKYDMNDYTAIMCGGTGKADLEAGTYYILVGGVTAGDFTFNVTKTAIEGGEEGGDEPEVTPAHDPYVLAIGDNTITIDGCTMNIANPPTAIEWAELVITEKGVYKVTSDTLKCYIYSEKNLASFTACVCGFTGAAELEPGTYYVCLGNEDVRGEHTVTVEKVGADVVLPQKNTMVVGDNHYVITDDLKAVGFEFITIEIAQPGTYVITGGAPMKVYMWTIPGFMGDVNFGWNIDANSETGFADSFEVTLTEAGTYWVGFNYEFVEEEREFDINISLKPAAQPTLIEMIISWIINLIQMILGWFKF